MKVRNGFVSNSSSSSFICEVCNNIQSGWDLCLSDAGMYECINGHVFCEEHIDKLTPEEYIFAGLEFLKNDIVRSEKIIEKCKEKIGLGLAEERYAEYGSITNQKRLEDEEEELNKSNKILEELTNVDINSKNFDFDDLIELVEEGIYQGDFRYSFPEKLCPVCKSIRKENETRDKNTLDPDWKIYVELYNKFSGINPKGGK